MAVTKIENLNKHENPSTNTNAFDIENYLNANWDIVEEVINNNAEELEQDTNIQKNTDDISEINAKNIAQDEEIESIKSKDTTQDNLIEELQTKVVELQNENTSLKNQIPQGEATGNPIHLSDSSDMECEIVPIGGAEQETRSGSNILNFNVTQNSKVTVNDDGTLTINGTGGFSLKISQITLKSGVTYYEKAQLVSGTITSDEGLSIKDAFMGFNGSNWIPSASFLSYTPSEDVSKSSIWINAGVTFENAVIKLWANTDQSDFEQYGASPSPDYPSEIVTVGQNGSVEIKVDNGLETTDTNYQSYTKVLPIQKEFVKIGDYEDTFVKVDGKWYEKHNYLKMILDGTEEWNYDKTTATFWTKKYNFGATSTYTTPKMMCNCLKVVAHINRANETIFLGSDGNLCIKIDDIVTIDDFKTWLSERYNIGTPVIAYCVLATPELIPCTEEQESILNSFYTYKGITNISVDGIGTLKVNYKKDLETIINNLSATSVAE